jgi:hypothetical protein
MKTLLTIAFILLFDFAFGQRPTNISGSIVDENRKPVSNAIIHYGKDYIYNDTAYTDNQGKFNVAYPNPQRFWYSFSVERIGFLPKTYFIDLSSKDIVVKNAFVLRSRKGFWYDSKQIDSTHVGITVRDAIKKYKLDIEACILWDEPPGKYYGFSTELADSSYILFTIQGYFSKEKRLKISDVLDSKIKGFGIAETNGNERVIGNGFINHANPYFIEQKMKTEQQ